MKRGCERKKEFVKWMEEGDEVGLQVTIYWSACIDQGADKTYP